MAKVIQQIPINDKLNLYMVDIDIDNKTISIREGIKPSKVHIIPYTEYDKDYIKLDELLIPKTIVQQFIKNNK